MLCAWRKKKKSIIKISSLTNIKISLENPPHYTVGGHDFIAPVGYSHNTYLHSIITSTFIVEWLFIVMRWFWFYQQRPPCTRALQRTDGVNVMQKQSWSMCIFHPLFNHELGTVSSCCKSDSSLSEVMYRFVDSMCHMWAEQWADTTIQHWHEHACSPNKHPINTKI